VYDRHEELIGEFFIERRVLVSYEELPQDFVNALLAVEDKRFFEHFGIDPIGFGRAVINNIQARKFVEGASTLTQQLTRVLFLSPEKKVVRKIKEWMLAIQIEQKYRNLEQTKEKAKQKILALYANQLYLGHGAYGVQSAAKLYFGKSVWELDLGECAMLAGLPQRPAAYSPITHPEIAKQRQEHVLKRMVIEGYITPKQKKEAFEKPFEKKKLPDHQINKSPYFVEHVRQYLEERYGYRVYQEGLQVYTTLDLQLQNVAQAALQENLRIIQKRHGFQLIDKEKTPEERAEKVKLIKQYEWKNSPQEGDVLHAIVTDVSSKQISVTLGEYVGTIDKQGFEWTKKNLRKILQPDDIVLVKVDKVDEENRSLRLTLDMEPLLEGALLSIDPKNGHILVMVGGYDFYRSKFNRAVQALRQPGSAFKPFVYLTALERGMTPADIIVDEPVTFVIDEQTEQFWSPRNFSGTHKGPMRLRHALETSTNVVAAKLIDQIGPHAVIDTARRLGISAHLNPYPSLALGGSEVYLLEMVSAYCAFANRGYHVEPVFVTKVLDSEGNVLELNVPRAHQVVSEDTTYLLVSMMEGVVQRGTAVRAKALGRPLAGKTGTTNDNTDAWFIGYSPSLVAGVWVGYDENRKPIGKRETGGRAALPIWMAFLEEALKDSPIEEFPVPAGVSFVQIDSRTGLLAAPQCGSDVYTEVFKKGTEPREYCYQSRMYSHRY
jgi:penicillin-binding protein 1A